MAQDNHKSKGNSYRYHGQKPYSKSTKNSLISNFKDTIYSYIPNWLKSDDYDTLNYPSTSHNQISSKISFESTNLLSEDEDETIIPKNLSPQKLKPHHKTNGYIKYQSFIETQTFESLSKQEDSFNKYVDAPEDLKQNRNLLNSSIPNYENVGSDKSNYVRPDNNIQTLGIKSFNLNQFTSKYDLYMDSKPVSIANNIINSNSKNYLNQSSISSFASSKASDIPCHSYTSFKNNRTIVMDEPNSSLFSLSKKHVENVQQNLSQLGSNFGKTKYGGSSVTSVSSNLKRKQRLSLFTPYKVSNDKRTNTHATTSMSGLNDKAQKILNMLGNIADQNQEGLNEVTQRRGQDELDRFPSLFQTSPAHSPSTHKGVNRPAITAHKTDLDVFRPQNTSLLYQHSPLFFKPPKAKISSPSLANNLESKQQAEPNASFSFFKQTIPIIPRPGQELNNSEKASTSDHSRQEFDKVDLGSTQYVEKKISLKPKLGPPIAGLKYLASPYSSLGAPKPLTSSSKESVSTGDHLKAQTLPDGNFVKSSTFSSMSTSHAPGATLSSSQTSSMEYIKDRPGETSKTVNKYSIPEFSFPQPEVPQVIRVAKNEHISKSRFSQDLHSKFKFKPYVTSAAHPIAPKSPITTTAPSIATISPKASNISAHPYKRFEKYDTDRRKDSKTDTDASDVMGFNIKSPLPSVLKKGSCLDFFGTPASSTPSNTGSTLQNQIIDDQWECSSCWVKNKGSAQACVCCETKNPSASNTSAPAAGGALNNVKFGSVLNANSSTTSTFRFVSPSPSSLASVGDLSKSIVSTAASFKMAAPQGWTCICSNKNMSSSLKCQVCNTPRQPSPSSAKENTNIFPVNSVVSSFATSITPSPPVQVKTSTFASSVSNSPMDISLTSGIGTTTTPTPLTFGTPTINFGGGKSTLDTWFALNKNEIMPTPIFGQALPTPTSVLPATTSKNSLPSMAIFSSSSSTPLLFGSIKTTSTTVLTSIAPPTLATPIFGSTTTSSSVAVATTPFTSSLFQNAPQPDFKPTISAPFKFDMAQEPAKIIEGGAKPIATTFAFTPTSFAPSFSTTFATAFGSGPSTNTARVAPQPTFSFGESKTSTTSNSTTGQATIFKFGGQISAPTPAASSFSFGTVNATSLHNGIQPSGFAFTPLAATSSSNQTVSGFNAGSGFNFGLSSGAPPTIAPSSGPIFNFTQTIKESANATTAGTLFNFGSGQQSNTTSSTANSLFGSNPSAPAFSFGAQPGNNQVTTAPPINGLFTFGSQPQHPTAQIPPLNGSNPAHAGPALQNAFNFSPAPVLGGEGSNPILGGFAMGSASAGQRKIKKPIRRLR